MLKILFLFLFSTLLYSNNPIVYAALGDVIYNNVESINKLKEIESYKAKYESIDAYLLEVNATKKMGFAIENGDKTLDKKLYLQKLRALSKKNDALVRDANKAFKQSLENEDSTLFAQLVNSGLIDTEKNKSEILQYYYGHNEDINVSDVISNYLEEERKSAQSKQRHKQYIKTKKMKEAEKIKRIRKRDLEEQEKLEKKLDAEVKRKKQEIRRELLNSK